MKVLLCDDHVLFCEALRATLSPRGHQVETAHHPDQAFERVAIGDIDVAVMDLGFPDGDSVAAISAMTKACPMTAVVVLTAAVDSRPLLAALDAGAAAVCSKSQRLAEITAVIERATSGDAVPSSDVVVRLLRRMHRHNDERRLGDFLTPREFEVLRRLVRGQNTHLIASEMGVSYSTTRTHIQSILAKLGVHSQLEATAFAVRNQLIQSG